MNEVVLNSKRFEIEEGITKLPVNPWIAKVGGEGLEYSSFQNVNIEEWHDFRGGIGRRSSLPEDDGRTWWSEGADLSIPRVAVLGPLINTAGTFGVAAIKILDFQDATYAIADNAIRKWNTSTSEWDIADPYLIHTCEAAWDEGVDGDATSALDTTIEKQGSGCAKFVVGAGLANGDIIATDDITSLDLSDSEKVVFWMRCSADRASGDLQLLLDDTANCASPVETIDCPALTADTWTLCTLTLANPSSDTAVISVGLKFTANAEACDIYLDHIMGTFPDPIDAIVITDNTDEYLVVSSATNACYTTDGTTWAVMEQWVSPTGFTDADSAWTDEANVYDGDTGTYLDYVSAGSYLELTFSDSVLTDRCRIYANNYNANIDFYYNGAWHDVFDGALAGGVWETKINSDGIKLVEKVRIEGSSDFLRIFEFDLYCGWGGYLASYASRLYWITTTGNTVTYSTAGDIDTHSGAFALTGNFGTLYDFFEGKLLADGTDTLYFCGTEGLYSLDISTELAYKQEVGYPPLTYSGHAGMYWNGNVWVATGYGILKVSSNLATYVGPDQDDGLPGVCQGYIYDFTTVNNWLVYCVNGGASNKSSIIKRNASVGGNLQIYTSGAGSIIPCIHHSPSSQYTNGRLWWGEGTSVRYAMFPDITSNVKQLSTYEYVANSDYIELPIFRKLAAVKKVALNLSAVTKSCNANEYVTIYYWLNGAGGTPTTLGTFKTSPKPTTLEFGSGAGIEFYTIQIVPKLQRGGTNTNSPELESLAFAWVGRPTRISSWTFRMRCTKEEFDELEAIYDTTTLVTFYPSGDTNQTSHNVAITKLPQRLSHSNMGRSAGVAEITVAEVYAG